MGMGSWYWYAYRAARRRAWSIRMFASAVRPATEQVAWAQSLYVFSDVCVFESLFFDTNEGCDKNLRAKQ